MIDNQDDKLNNQDKPLGVEFVELDDDGVTSLVAVGEITMDIVDVFWYPAEKSAKKKLILHYYTFILHFILHIYHCAMFLYTIYSIMGRSIFE